MRRGNPNPSPATRFDGSKAGPGRPKGSRAVLSERFLSDLCADWAEHGAATLRTVRACDPSTYIRVAAGLVPSHLSQDRPLASLTDAELGSAIEVVRKAIAAGSVDG